MLAIPISAQSRCFAATYHRLPGSSPTSTVPSPGTTPREASAAIRTLSSAFTAANVALPSRMVAVGPVTGPDPAMTGPPRPRPEGSRWNP